MTTLLLPWLLTTASAASVEEREVQKVSCERGEAVECTSLGLRYRDGRGAPLDAHYAVGLFRKGCEFGDSAACVHEADAYRSGLGVQRDIPRAIKMFTEACTEKDVARACRSLGEIYLVGDGTSRDNKLSAFWYGMGCDAGDPESCVGAAMATERGDDGAADPQAGRLLLAKACELFHARGCTLLGERYLYGRDGAVKDPELAGAMFSAGCELRDAEACRMVGRMSMTGKGMPQDHAAASIYLTDACAWGDYVGCRYLADVLKLSSFRKAAKAAEHGCSLGDKASCKKIRPLTWKAELAGQ